MTVRQRPTESALETLARDVLDQSRVLDRLRVAVASGAFPSGAVEVTMETEESGRVRMGLRNRATGGTYWFTDWF